MRNTMEKELAIETRALTKFYGKSLGIRDLDLSVEKGDFFGFIGPNGAGKSTTIRTLLGLIRKTSGDAKVLGYDIVDDKEEILKRTGYLPSEIWFYHDMKVKDALKYSADLRKTDCKERASELCKRLDLDPNRKVEDLSLGNRKKVGIICAVQHHPELLILDEPTSGLDPLMQKEFFSILKEENRRGATIFFSSHILSEVQAYCKSAAFIKEGKILLSDKVGELGQTGARKVTILGDVPKERFSDLPGVTFTENERDEGISFLYKGDIKLLLSILSKEEIRDLTITEPSLEEIFMHYYES